MKTILSLIGLVFLVSCSSKPPAFNPYEPAANAVPAETPAAPSEVVAPPALPDATNHPAASLPPDSSVAIESTNALAQTNSVMTSSNAVVAGTVPVTPGPAAALPAPPPRGLRPPGAPPLGAPPSGAGLPSLAPVRPVAGGQREEMVTAGMIDFRGADLKDVLQLYCEYVNRTLLRQQNLPEPKIWLKNQTPLTKRELIRALDKVLGMNGITMINIDEKFVEAVPAGEAGQAGGAINYTNDPDTLAEFGQYETHVVQLQFAKPSEVVGALQPFSKIPNAAMAIDSSGIIVLRDYTENVKRMLEMITRIDVMVPSEYVSEVIPIRNALATDLQAALSSLSTGGSSATVGGGGSSGGGGGGGGGAGGARGFSSGNSLGGNTGTSGAGGSSTAARTPFGSRPGTTSGGYGQPQGSASPLGSGAGGAGGAGSSFTDRVRSLLRASGANGDFQILGQTKIIADDRSNSLLVFASRQDMAMIKDIISKLDVVLAQVLIEAIIMEVSLDDGRNLGISVAQSPKQHGDFTGVGGYNNGQNFFDFLGAASSNSFPGNFTSILPSGAGKSFSYWGKLGADYDIAIQAAANDNRINVLSRPRIQTSHNKTAKLFIGQSVPYITGTSFGDFGGVSSRSQYQEKQIGITLDVTPLINPGGLVVLDIYQDIGQRGADVLIDGNPVPIINQRVAQAVVSVNDRDTIMLGGFISTTKGKNRSGVPYLKDIPVLGNLFRSTTENNSRTELIVLLRPTVLQTPEAAALTAEVERSKLPGVRRAEKEIRDDDERRLKKVEQDFEADAKKRQIR